MNKAQSDFVLSLDPEGLDGTIQSMIMCQNLQEVSFEQFMKVLVRRVLAEKQFLVQDNVRAWRKVNELQK
jgi:hypothetical protein